MDEIFIDHIITKISETEWIWKNPETLTYWMGIKIFENRIIIIGDFWDWIFCPYSNRTRQFLLGSNNKDYFWEKLSNKPAMSKRIENEQKKKFDQMWKGLEAFREKYWQIYDE